MRIPEETFFEKKAFPGTPSKKLYIAGFLKIFDFAESGNLKVLGEERAERNSPFSKGGFSPQIFIHEGNKYD